MCRCWISQIKWGAAARTRTSWFFTLKIPETQKCCRCWLVGIAPTTLRVGPLYELRTSRGRCLWAVTVLFHYEYRRWPRDVSDSSLQSSFLCLLRLEKAVWMLWPFRQHVTASSEMDGAMAGLQEGLGLNIWGRNTVCNPSDCCQWTKCLQTTEWDTGSIAVELCHIFKAMMW